MFKVITLTMILFSSQIKADVEFNGVDLNPALLGCIMSGGSCLSNTGIFFIDVLFGGGRDAAFHTDESFCYAYLGNWCSGPAGYPSAYYNCRESKKSFYKMAKQKMGEWNPPTGQRPNNYRMWTEEDYFEELERWLGQPKYGQNPPYFTCTARQQYLWLKNRCGHTEIYKKYRNPYALYIGHPPEVWNNELKTPICEKN